jgi:signal transduction histidine kinase
VQYYSEGKWASYVLPGFDGATVVSDVLFVDRNHSLWVGTESHGLYHIHDGVADHYGSANGLSGDTVGYIYEDREGNLWVTTDRGVDMFRDLPVLTFSTAEGLIGSVVHSVLALSNGSVWVGNLGAVNIIRAGRVSAIAAGHGLPGQQVHAMFQDHTGQIWLGVDNTIVTYKLGRFSAIKNSDETDVGRLGSARGFAEDAEGNIWALTHIDVPDQIHLLRIKDGNVKQDIRVDDVIRASFLAADRNAGIWLASADGKFVHYRNGNAEAVVSLGNEEISIRSFFVDSDNAVSLATSKGFYRWKGGRMSVMDSRNGLPCTGLSSAIKDDYGSFWLKGRCGLLRVPASDYKTWLKFPEAALSVKTFDAFDGSQSGYEPGQPEASKSADGRLWFASGENVQMIDPSRTYTNVISPPVYVAEVIADRKNYLPSVGLRLPALTRDLEIDYTALSFSVPRKVGFRYKLEGRDAGWQEAGTRRQAFYTDLRPGNYGFRVMACNNDGVWNEEGATLEFSIAPAWFQTAWFRLLCVLSGAVVAWAIYRLRVRQVARAISARFDERLAERTRMARELHDTFIQTVQGSKLVADDALDPSTDLVRMRHAMEQLSVWLEQAMREGRAALNSLRTSTTQKNDLAEAFRRATDNGLMPGSMQANFSVVGDARNMHPIVRDEVYRIGYEAIRNAYKHSQASRLDVELRYAQDLALRVRDNGVGIDPSTAALEKDGHFGLRGMRERAARIGGKLTLVSSANSGTEITIVIPGGIVFQKESATPIEKMKALLRRMG